MIKIVRLTIWTVLMLQFSCNTNSEKAAGGKVKIEREGVTIDYDDSKTGDTSLLFIHGWDIDKTYWANQVSYFSPRYRVVTVDLPGFGKSGKNRNSWTVEDYGKDVMTVITKLNLKNIIIIGHSMSGAIALETALTNPARVMAVVGVDNFTNVGAVISQQEKQSTANAYQALRTNYKQTALMYATQYLFSPSTDSIVKKRVIHDFLNADSTLAVNILEKNDSYPIDEKLKSLGKTLYLINSNYRPTDTTGLIKNKIPYQLLYVGPTGHYPMIEKPGEFNKLLEQIISNVGKTGPLK